jgi:hypothetical protein
LCYGLLHVCTGTYRARYGFMAYKGTTREV